MVHNGIRQMTYRVTSGCVYPRRPAAAMLTPSLQRSRPMAPRLIRSTPLLALSLLAAALFSQGVLADNEGLAVTPTEVTVGKLHSATGTMAISETGSIQAERLAIDQINAAGGVLGRKIKIIQEDGASDWPTFAE